MSSVTLPRGVVVALVAALALCLGVAAFLAGRASLPAVPAAAATPGPAPGQTARFAPPPPTAGHSAAPVPYVPPAAVQAVVPEPAGVVASLPPAAHAEAARVARYFQEMETAQASAKYWSDPQALAGTLVDGLSKGDRSGFDQLIAATNGAVERMRAVDVPSDCSEHHGRSLELVARGVALLKGMADAAAAGDANAFASIPAQARQLETEAKDVDALAARIKQRYGIV